MSPATPSFRPASAVCAAIAAAALLLGGAAVHASTSVYKWVDASGVTHLSSAKPPVGTPYERVTLATTKPSSNRSGTSGNSPTRVASAATTPEQASRRNEMVTSLQNRECVVALEAIDRVGKGGQAVDPAEFRRLQQTADQNCSKDPVQRGQQEEMAARLRVAKGDTCVDARNKLADMLAPGRKPSREQLKVQQEFIEAHCTAPVR
jgi:hypothetical protein